MQKHVNLEDLVKSFPTNIFLQNLASIQKRTSPMKFAHLAEKSVKGSISNLSTKVDAHVEYASNAFEYEFDGESAVEIPKVPLAELGPFALGVLVGPSGSGKSKDTIEY